MFKSLIKSVSLVGVVLLGISTANATFVLPVDEGDATYNSDLSLSFGAIGEWSRVQYFNAEQNPGVLNLPFVSMQPTINERLVITNTGAEKIVFQAELGVLSPNQIPDDVVGVGEFESLIIQSTTSPLPFYATPNPFLDPDPDSVFAFFSLMAGESLDLRATGLVGDANNFFVAIQAVPVPAAGVLFGSALLGAAALRRRKLQQKLGLPQ